MLKEAGQYEAKRYASSNHHDCYPYGLIAKCAARLKNARNIAKMPTYITVVEVRGMLLVLLGD
jgi:hypothetical protein